jgi:hypothetical protein
MVQKLLAKRFIRNRAYTSLVALKRSRNPWVEAPEVIMDWEGTTLGLEDDPLSSYMFRFCPQFPTLSPSVENYSVVIDRVLRV